MLIFVLADRASCRPDVACALQNIIDEGTTSDTDDNLIDDETTSDTDDTQQVRQPRTVPTVIVPNVGPMFKATLVAQFNREPNISAERLKRIRSTSTTKPQGDGPSLADSAATIGLYDDVAILLKESGTSKYVLARVIRMRKKGQTRGYVEYKKPVSLADKSQVTGVEIIVQKYDMLQDNHFTLNKTYHVYPISKVISSVNVVFNVQSGEYEIQPDEASLLESVVAAENVGSSRPGGSRGRQSIRPGIRRHQNMSDEGRRMVQGSSRSGRIYNRILYEFS